MRTFLLYLFAGLILITASCGKKSDVTPVVPPVKTEPDRSFTLSETNIILTAGSSQVVMSTKYTNDKLTWSSSDATVATVSNAGSVAALKAGTTTITATSIDYPVKATCTITVTEQQIKAIDIGIGGTATSYFVFIVGVDNSVSRLVNNTLTKLPDCAAVRIAVSPAGLPWIVDKTNRILKYNGTAWEVIPGSATDIGIGGDGSVYAVGTVPVPLFKGLNVMRWNGTGWDDMPNIGASRIAVSREGAPHVVDGLNRYISVMNIASGTWRSISTLTASDIAVATNNNILITGEDLDRTTSPQIYKYDIVLNFQPVAESGLELELFCVEDGCQVY